VRPPLLVAQAAATLTALSASPSLSVLIRIQMLSELEEIITYKRQADQPHRQATMRKTWMKRCAPVGSHLGCSCVAG
jgi:FKBP12-rapamycin complex-associated protein